MLLDCPLVFTGGQFPLTRNFTNAHKLKTLKNCIIKKNHPLKNVNKPY